MGTDTFWGLSGTAWTGIYTLLTAGLLAVAVVAALYAKRQWESARRRSRRFQQQSTLSPGQEKRSGASYPPLQRLSAHRIW